MPAVTIVVPVFNGARFLPQRIPRLRREAFADVEVLIVDDGSADDSAGIARALSAGDPRVRVIALERNGGVAKARERGAAEATGRYVWFVDADDDWPDDALSRLVEAAERDRLDVVVADARFVYDGGAATRPLQAPRSGPVDGRTAFRMLLNGRITGHLWNKLFRADVARAMSFAPARVHSDLAMVADGLANAERVGFLPVVVYDYRLRAGSIITTKSSRAASLELVGTAVEAAADRIGISPNDDDLRYFRARYILLSGIKDGVQGPYSPQESAVIVARLRRSLAVGELAVLARRRDARRLALAVAAKTSMPVYRRLLRVAER